MAEKTNYKVKLKDINGGVIWPQTSITNIVDETTGLNVEVATQGYADEAAAEALATAQSDATTKANNAKSEAIAAAASDATTKANEAEKNAKAYTDGLISDIKSTGVSYEVVDVLPTTDIKAGTVYLVPDTAAADKNTRIEYMYVNGAWQIIGTTVADLTTKADKESPTFTGTVTVPVVAEGAANTVAANKGYVDGVGDAAIAAAASDATTKAGTAKAEAIAAAASDATTKANNAKSEAIAAAASDATTKAGTAKSEAIAAAASDATTKAGTAEKNAKDYTDEEIEKVNNSLVSAVYFEQI